eukprot:gene22419-29531_t
MIDITIHQHPMHPVPELMPDKPPQDEDNVEVVPNHIDWDDKGSGHALNNPIPLSPMAAPRTEHPCKPVATEDPAGTSANERINLDNLSHKEAFKTMNKLKAQFRTVYDSRHVARPDESCSPDSMPDLIPFAWGVWPQPIPRLGESGPESGPESGLLGSLAPNLAPNGESGPESGLLGSLALNLAPTHHEAWGVWPRMLSSF